MDIFFFQMDNFQIVKHKDYFEQPDEKCILRHLSLNEEKTLGFVCNYMYVDL